MIGGGDQLYCDDVWNLPSLVQVRAIVNMTVSIEAPTPFRLCSGLRFRTRSRGLRTPSPRTCPIRCILFVVIGRGKRAD